MPVTVSSRQHALNRQIQRLSRLFTRQESIIERLSWIRLILFLFFVVVVFVTARRFSTTVTVFTGLLCFCIFNLVAFFHRQRIRYKKRLKMWHRFKSSQAARMSCDWRNIPLRKIEDHLPTSHILADLDITGPQSLFHLIDMTITDKAGRRLVELLGRATPDLAVIKKNQRLVQELFLMPHFRNKLLRIFFLISSDLVHTDALLNWLKIKKPARLLTRMMPVAVFWVAINIALFIGFVLSIIPPYWILSLSFYTAFHLLSQRIINIFFEMIIQLDEELTKFRRALRVLENYPFLPGGALARLCRPFTSLRISPSRQLRRIKFLTAAVGLRMNPMMNMALNLVLPYDFICSYLAHRVREKMLNILPSWVDRFADFEVLFSLANFAYLNPEHVFPRIKTNNGNRAPVFQVRSLAHPLLPFQTRVSNDFCLTKPGETVIITGSNMSGKSTFLKTIGVNFCLAYA
ncbi:hypothetical protein JW935_23385, partial [candidate division KSB1 bacterium]|nr:hypothetical protein [candidate division KSB1 bacterium]